MATVNLRDAARSAWQAKESDRVTAARTALGEVIGPENAADTALDVEAVEAFDGGYSVVFVDAAGVHVAVQVRDAGTEVHLAQRDGEKWRNLGGRVESLAHLWLLIDEHLPEQAAAPAWSTQAAYKVGDQVTYGGATYECIQLHTSQAGWEPPNVPALWVKVA